MKNRTKILEQKRIWYQNNKDKISARRTEWWKGKSDEYKKSAYEQVRLWKIQNRDRCLEHNNLRDLKRRHKLGINKKYVPRTGLSNTREYKNLLQRKRDLLARACGELSMKTIQMLYEDNIKKYGTLTFYLCSAPISFGNDSFEHKTPISRGGTNEYNNLAIACRNCNSKKGTKTEEEYRKWVCHCDEPIVTIA